MIASAAPSSASRNASITARADSTLVTRDAGRRSAARATVVSAKRWSAASSREMSSRGNASTRTRPSGATVRRTSSAGSRAIVDRRGAERRVDAPHLLGQRAEHVLLEPLERGLALRVVERGRATRGTASPTRGALRVTACASRTSALAASCGEAAQRRDLVGLRIGRAAPARPRRWRHEQRHVLQDRELLPPGRRGRSRRA